MHFEVSERKILLRLFDVLAVIGGLSFVGHTFNFSYFTITEGSFYWTVVLALYLNILGTVFEMYNLQVASNQFQIIKSIVLTSSTTVLFFLLTPIFTPLLPSNRLQIIYFFLSITISLFIWRLFYQKFLASQRFVKKVIIVCDQNQLEELTTSLEKADPHYKVVGFVDTDSQNANVDADMVSIIRPVNLDEIEIFVRKNGVSEIVIASQKTDGITVELYNNLLVLLENGFVIRAYTQVYEAITHRIPIQHFDKDFYRYFPFSRSNQNRLYLLIVRLLELTFSIIGLLGGLVILPFVLIGNLIGNRGPLFYTQTRVGKNGVPFEIYKYRTMIKNAESGGIKFATQGDARITPFGRLLRKSRIDEIPQFINILKGDMGFIGPRPERPFFVKELAAVMPFYETRHVIKPGLTGWAQVNYSYGESIEESLIKLQYDLYYIKHRSIFLDLNIVIKTFSTVLFYRGQ
ncbi:exopolysaccharide biosynthesis polyprenyl glycosylphosphotransferase [Flavobacterium arsenatis]|uniref:Exopolysaccharide biosynthesis polyprenyl glycosylphosphotransferase n=2 Tax=Flavobacterium arsenatis TaxID=1484332 RepID=A0ABU1TM17_9FLAO|nr:exopolysaccharide biosynthesis polyprenyl glycosylphosphotransferase [Flavobacterium arsenatis]